MRHRLAGACLAAVVLASAGLSGGSAAAAPTEIGDPPRWAAARVAWRAAVDARRTARWEEPLASLVAKERQAAAAESLYRAHLFAWTPGPSALRVPLDVLRQTALDCIAWNRPDLASALLEGPLRDDELLLPLRAAARGRTGSPAEGLALLDWPPDRRPSDGASGGAAKRPDRRAGAHDLARLLTAASLSESARDGRAERAAWQALIKASRPGAAVHEFARLRLAERYVADGTPRLAVALLRRPDSGDQAVVLGDAMVATGDTLGAVQAMLAFGAGSNASLAERYPALRRAASWAVPFANRLSAEEHADLCGGLGRVGEADLALEILAARTKPAKDADEIYARGELEASLLARARRHGDAAAAYRALALLPDLPRGAPERIALGLARASRGGRAFDAMDSAYIAAVTLAGRGRVAEAAAWERAREWEDERSAREAARIFDWAAGHIRSNALRAAARVHEAISWRRAGEPDSALLVIADVPASDEMGVFWRGKLALLAGDSTAALADFLRAAKDGPTSYEGIRGAEEAARLGHRARDGAADEPPLAGRRAASVPDEIEIRLLGALGWRELAADLLRRCARGGEAPDARVCIDALEEGGTFRVGKRSLLPADRFDYPPAFPGAVLEAAAAESLPPSLLWGIMRQESAYDPLARSKAGALGLLQLLPTTAAQLAGREIPEDSLTVAALNVRLGARYVRDLLREFGDPRAVLASYNAGEKAVRRWNRDRPVVDDEWVERIPYRETRDYVKRVYAAWRRYEAIYGAGGSGTGG